MALFFEELSRPGNDTGRLFTGKQIDSKLVTFASIVHNAIASFLPYLSPPGECLPTKQLTYIPTSLLCLAAELVFISGCCEWLSFCVGTIGVRRFSPERTWLTALILLVTFGGTSGFALLYYLS